MAGSLRKVMLDRPPAAGDDLPEDIVRALNGSADDLETGRIVELDKSLKEMEAELEAHLARGGAAPR